jgi:CheY-like chemotaxis protein
VRILVVDDEPAICEAVERALRLEGHDVALAADGGEALDALGVRRPDAVVLDVVMSCVDDLELAASLPRRVHLRDGRVERDERERRAGADHGRPAPMRGTLTALCAANVPRM